MGTAITGTQTRTLKASVVTELPDKGVSNKIYYVPNGTTGDNKYDEYIWIKNAEHPNGYFEKVGQKDIDLEPYALTEEVDKKLKTKVDKVTGKELSTNDFTDSYKTSLDNWFNRSNVRPIMSLSDLENKKDISAGIYPINDGNNVWKYLIAFPRTLAGTASIELLAHWGNPLKYRLYLKDTNSISSWKTLATTDVATSTSNGLMSKEDKVGFTNLKSSSFSYIGANNIHPFTATKTSVTLNYASYNSNLWGGKGVAHSEAIPLASSTQAGIITAADKVKLDSLSPKQQLFIDMWNSACGTYGKYNTETGFYELNGLTDITYEQALAIYRVIGCETNNSYRPNVRTILFSGCSRVAMSTWCRFEMCTKIEVIRQSDNVYYNGSVDSMFDGCVNLKAILGLVNINNITSYSYMFRRCVKLENFTFKGLNSNLTISDSPLITYNTLNYLISNALGNKVTTVSVHPTTYAYLQGTTAPTEQVGGTTEQWQALVTAATNKKISLATPK